uniref:RUN domain-containing protein n=1 Tax=Macrostomum lignano TaxID=282301 RepID=A0A1I8G075_9PLAT
GRPVGVGRSHSDLQHGRRYIAAQQQQQLPSLAFLRDSLPLGDPSSVVAAAAAASASSATTTADAAGDSGIGTAVGDGSVSASAASNFVCRNCGHPQHQQQLARRLAGGKQKRSQSLDTTAASAAAAAAAAADEAEAAESKSAERLRRAARRRVARATDSSRKQRGGLGGSGAKRTLSEPHRLCSVSSATAAGGTAANSGSGAGASGSGVGYDMTQSLTDSQEEESSAAAAATPHRSTTPQAASSSARRDYPDDSDDGGGGGGFRAKKSVSFCDRIQFHSPKGQAAASPTAGSAAAGQIWRGGVGSTVDLGAAAAVLPSGDSPHRQQTLLRRPLSLQLNYDVQVIPQQVGLYGDNDSPPLVFCGSPVGSPRRTAESTAAASQQQRQSRLDRLSQLVSDAIRGVNDLILAATASPLAAGTADASNQQRLSSVLSQSLCPPLHGLLTDELLSSGGSGGSGPGSRLSFGRSRSQLWQLIEETCKPSGQPASRRLNEVLRQVRSVGGLSTERLKFNAFVAACLNSKQLSAWFHHAASSESILKRYYKPGAFLRSAQTVHCELFADLSTSLELLNSHSFGIELAVSASSSVTAAGQNNSRSKPAGQQPLKARHDIKTQQPPPPPPPPPQHQRPAAPAPPPRVQSRLPRPTSSADSATASSSVSIGSSVSSTASSTAA